MKYYVSSKLHHGDKWKESGINSVSSWIHGGRIEGKDALSDMWDRYYVDITKADAFVMYLELGEVPKGALVELGMAFALLLPIYFIWDGEVEELEKIVGTLVHHKSVTIISMFEDLPE